MKRIFIGLLILGLLAACGGGTNTTENKAPTAAFSLDPASGNAPLTVNLDASNSQDSDGSIATYSWDFGDDSAKAEGVTTEHTFTDSGSFEITLSVTDDDGATDKSTQTVTVEAPDVVDPAPELNTPGEYGCDGCPDTSESTEDITVDDETVLPITGNVTEAEGDGSFYLRSSDGEAIDGPISTPTSGAFSVTIPLFCGEQILKRVWSNDQGRYVIVNSITVENCTDTDIRLTLTWDDLGLDFELHLIKEGGRINDNATDCTWTSCISSSPDWGVKGDDSDNPRKDVDDTGNYGPENIYLSKPENGIYTVMVEHWGSGSPEADGDVILNVAGKTVRATVENLPSQYVWTVGTIAWPSGEIVLDGDVFDCSGSWSSGCQADIP